MLSHSEAVRLRRESPREFDRRAVEESEFLFGVRDHRAEQGREWGGEMRIVVNQNVVVHLVPGWNDEMRGVDELPQFAVLPDDEREGEDRTHRYEAVKDLEAFDGVVFYVSRAQYDRILAELGEASRLYGDYLRLPDSLFTGAVFVELLNSRVLPHPVVAAERPYDFSKRTF